MITSNSQDGQFGYFKKKTWTGQGEGDSAYQRNTRITFAWTNTHGYYFLTHRSRVGRNNIMSVCWPTLPCIDEQVLISLEWLYCISSQDEIEYICNVCGGLEGRGARSAIPCFRTEDSHSRTTFKLWTRAICDWPCTMAKRLQRSPAKLVLVAEDLWYERSDVSGVLHVSFLPRRSKREFRAKIRFWRTAISTTGVSMPYLSWDHSWIISQPSAAELTPESYGSRILNLIAFSLM
jgi:hypothetical protein